MSSDVFLAVNNSNALLKIVLVEQSNLHAQQNGSEFQNNEDEVKAF